MFRFVLTFLNSRKFNHLDVVGQTYTEHFSDSICYSWECCKGAFYFLVHAIYPDVFKTDGSNTIFKLTEIIENKLNKIMEP